MSRNRVLTTALLLFVVVFGFFLRHRTKLQTNIQATAAAPPALSSSTAVVPPVAAKPGAPKPTPNAAPASPQQLASLSQMTKTLFEFIKPDRKLKDLVGYLKASGQEPFITRDHNQYTGDMMIVNTRSPLTGTRYFHAQYFSDQHNEAFVQHMSFEFKPGPEAMNQALNAVKTSFPNLGTPSSQKADFAQWDLPGGYVIWVKKMAKSDLDDNPFNAYGPEDIGTIRVAVELNPEEG